MSVLTHAQLRARLAALPSAPVTFDEDGHGWRCEERIEAEAALLSAQLTAEAAVEAVGQLEAQLAEAEARLKASPPPVVLPDLSGAPKPEAVPGTPGPVLAILETLARLKDDGVFEDMLEYPLELSEDALGQGRLSPLEEAIGAWFKAGRPGLSSLAPTVASLTGSVTPMSWGMFRSCGLLWWINRILHTFGWVIVLSYADGSDPEVNEPAAAYPARCGFRGFDRATEEAGFQAISDLLESAGPALAAEARGVPWEGAAEE